MSPQTPGKSGLSRYGPVILWALLIFSISSIPNLSTPVHTFRLVDKIAHFIEFGIFGYLLMYAFVPGFMGLWRRRTAFAFFTGILCGFFDEMYQSLIPGRVADPYDAVADALGVLTAIVLWVVLHRRKSLAS